MKQIAIVIALCVGAWFFLVGGRKLDESKVRSYYEQEAHATLSRDPERLCKQLSSKAVVKQRVIMLGQSTEATMNRDQACEATRQSFEMFKEMGDQLGGTLYIEYDYHIERVEVAPNRQSATVEGTSVLKIGQTMVFRNQFKDRLVGELGKVRLISGEVVAKVSMGGERRMSQSEFAGR